MIVRYEVVSIVVTDTKLFNQTGDVGRWARRVEARFTANAKAEAPHGGRKGRWNKSQWSKSRGYPPAGGLQRSISGEVVRIGPRHLQTTVVVDVPYALHVIHGTGTIFAKSARVPAGLPGAGRFTETGFGEGGMYIPGNPGWGKSRMRQRVRGQSANNFLGRAFDRTAITHPSLRGYQMVG